jgi:hypothetical protein
VRTAARWRRGTHGRSRSQPDRLEVTAGDRPPHAGNAVMGERRRLSEREQARLRGSGRHRSSGCFGYAPENGRGGKTLVSGLVELRLHDVDDASAFAWRVVGDCGFDLRPHEAEDLHAFLIATCWELSLAYDADRDSVRFSTLAYRRLRQRSVDWLRRERGRVRWQFSGRTHERRRPEFVCLDDRLVDADARARGRSCARSRRGSCLAIRRARSRRSSGPRATGS